MLPLLHCLRKFGETLSSAVDCGDLDLLAEQAQHELAADAARRARYDGNALLFAHPLLPWLWAKTLRHGAGRRKAIPSSAASAHAAGAVPRTTSDR